MQGEEKAAFTEVPCIRGSASPGRKGPATLSGICKLPSDQPTWSYSVEPYASARGAFHGTSGGGPWLPHLEVLPGLGSGSADRGLASAVLHWRRPSRDSGLLSIVWRPRYLSGSLLMSLSRHLASSPIRSRLSAATLGTFCTLASCAWTLCGLSSSLVPCHLCWPMCPCVPLAWPPIGFSARLAKPLLAGVFFFRR